MKRIISSEAQLTQILHAVANGITVQDTTGKLVFVNEAAACLMNCDSAEAALKKGGAEIIKGFKFFDEQGKTVQLTDLPGRLALSGVAEPAKVVGYTSDKQEGIRWTSIKALPIFDAEGKVTFAVNVLEDITELKATERRLTDANDRITKLLEQTLYV